MIAGSIIGDCISFHESMILDSELLLSWLSGNEMNVVELYFMSDFILGDSCFGSYYHFWALTFPAH